MSVRVRTVGSAIVTSLRSPATRRLPPPSFPSHGRAPAAAGSTLTATPPETGVPLLRDGSLRCFLSGDSFSGRSGLAPASQRRGRRSFHASLRARGDGRSDDGGGGVQPVDSDIGLAVAATSVENGDDDGSPTESHTDIPGDGSVTNSFTDVPGATTGKGRKLVIVFTCTVCETRSAKQFTENAYRNGCVMVRCPGCENLHLISDRLGMFEDKGVDGKGWDVESALASAGENVVVKTGKDVLELTLEDVLGKKAA